MTFERLSGKVMFIRFTVRVFREKLECMLLSLLWESIVCVPNQLPFFLLSHSVKWKMTLTPIVY